MAPRCSRISSAIWRRMSPRLTGVSCAHAGCAAFASATARCTSAAPERATCPMLAPVAGSTLPNVRPSMASASWLPIWLGMTGGMSRVTTR
jgi:hypothetical protein